jgi:paired amphipathic helix protein Sin3a
LLYSRLLLSKEIGQKLANSKHEHLIANPVAVELGLEDPNGPASILASLNGGSGVETTENVVYMYLQDAWDRVFAGELDQASFEEHMRWFFGNKVRLNLQAYMTT